MTTTPTRSAEQAMFDLTGFDEIAIARHFGRHLAVLKDEPFQLMRALAFVDARREGMKDTDAYRHAMSLTIQAVSDMYDDPTDPDESAALDQDAEGKAP